MRSLRIAGALVGAALVIAVGAGEANAAVRTETASKAAPECTGAYIRNQWGENTGAWSFCNGGTFRAAAECLSISGTLHTAYGPWTTQGWPPRFSNAHCRPNTYAVNQWTELR